MIRVVALVLVFLGLGCRLAWQADLPTPIDLNLISTLEGMALVLALVRS